jgi:hypothetical protein
MDLTQSYTRMWYDFRGKRLTFAHFLLSKETFYIFAYTLNFNVQVLIHCRFFPNVWDEKRRVCNRKSDVGYTFLKIVKITNYLSSIVGFKNNFRYFTINAPVPLGMYEKIK